MHRPGRLMPRTYKNDNMRPLDIRKSHLLMQWNCAGLGPRFAELSLFLQQSPIPILALTEAGLPGNTSLSGYVAHKNPSIATFPNGSAALYVRRDVPHIVLPVQQLCTDVIEVAAVRVRLGEKDLSVASVYVRARARTSLRPFLELLCDQCPAPRVICGDFNAHHSLWGDKTTDARGKDLVDSLDPLSLTVANDGSPTFYRPPPRLVQLI